MTELEYFTRLKKEYKSRDRNYICNITHSMNINQEDNYIVSELTPTTILGIMNYIESLNWSHFIRTSKELTENTMIEIIDKFYCKVKVIDKPYKTYYNLDRYENWEMYSHYDYEKNMPEFYREGLKEYIENLNNI